jgi:hypothetical protein
MKVVFVFSSFVVIAAFLLTTADAAAQSRLGQAADSLEDSLKALEKEFERRGDRFRDVAGSLFRSLDKTRTDSDRLAKEAGENKPKWQLQTPFADLRAAHERPARGTGPNSFFIRGAPGSRRGSMELQPYRGGVGIDTTWVQDRPSRIVRGELALII